jgi:hypothetical protein
MRGRAHYEIPAEIKEAKDWTGSRRKVAGLWFVLLYWSQWPEVSERVNNA